ncbi:MAG: hypothetical protein WBA29_06240, partial [Xanthobacteraceae bacterium]
AGTHNHRLRLLSNKLAPWMEPNRCGVWVPACAGTTLFELQIRAQKADTVHLSATVDMQQRLHGR